MKLLFAFGFIPVPVFYVSRLFADGFSPLVCIFIKNVCRGDEGLHQHELEHIRQAYKTLLLPHALLYLLWGPYRQWAEVEAYKVSIAYGMSVDLAARYLSTNYRLGVSLAEARELLK